MASGLDNTALMKGQSAKAASSETSPVAHQAEFHFTHSRDSFAETFHQFGNLLAAKEQQHDQCEYK